jgi:hypothetical protein
LSLLPIATSGHWVKGHYSGPNKRVEHALNSTADCLATEHITTAHRSFQPSNVPLFPPTLAIRILHNGSVITSKLYHVLSTAAHDASIIHYIQEKVGWTQVQFDKVHWSVHGRAFCRLTRFQQLMTSKLIHNQVYTNRWHHFIQGGSNQCPSCTTQEETLECILVCPHPSVEEYWQGDLAILTDQLRSIKTPTKIIVALLHGFQRWIAHSTVAWCPTTGSSHQPDVHLTAAFQEQYHSLGCHQLCLGCISLLWSQAAVRYDPNLDPECWASLVIHAFWPFTSFMWKYRNTVVHGTTLREKYQKCKDQIEDTVWSLYRQFEADPNTLLPRHHYLFTSLPLPCRISQPYDNTVCWIRSLERAHLTLSLHVREQQCLASAVFGTSLVSSTDSSYADSLSDTDTATSLAMEPTCPSTLPSLSHFATSVTSGSLLDSDSMSSCPLSSDSVSSHSNADCCL